VTEDSQRPALSAQRLSGVRILVTRPAAQADTLCRMIESEGGVAVRLPLLAIEPVMQPATARQRLAGGHDGWIFTSANAVRHALPLLPPAWPRQVAAIGPATATALAAAGREIAATPVAAASSEALLELPELQQVEGRRLLIVTGEGGRHLLEETLAARGAAIERAEVYRRVSLPYPPDDVAAALRKSDVVTVTSGTVLEHLVRLTPEGSRASLLKKPLVAPSERVVEQARALGFARPHAIAEAMSDAAVCAACARAAAR